MMDSQWDETLVIQIAGRDGGPPTIIQMARPLGGRVPMREWPNGEWTEPAIEGEPSCEEVAARLTRARQVGHRVSEDPLRIQRWLEGGA
jgi:hypothetical protein